VGSLTNKIYGKVYNAYKKIQETYSYWSYRQNNPAISPENKLLLNVGAGNWKCLGWLNLDFPSEWYKSAQEKNNFIAYDIRSDKIPFESNSVDAIYCSHVIEHIENEFVKNMFAECYRVLKKDSVFRIACPDAEFLYNISQFRSDYWEWRKYDWFKSDLFNKKLIPREVDFLVRDIATPKLLGYKFSISQEEYLEQFNSMPMNDFFDFLTSDLNFRQECPGDHINYWTYEKMRHFLQGAGFENVVKSKYMGSCCCEMTIRCKFDLTYPGMTLYVEALK
jgi:SAM-dependent methyltransferase